MVPCRSVRTGTTALVLLFGLVACAAEDPSATTGGADSTTTPPTSAATASIAGTYECLLPGTTEADTCVLAEDGTLTITRADGVAEPPGTWSVEGDQGMFVTPDWDEPFTVVDSRLVLADTTECTMTG